MENGKVLIRQAKSLKTVNSLKERKRLEEEMNQLIKENQYLKQVLRKILAESAKAISIIGNS